MWFAVLLVGLVACGPTNKKKGGSDGGAGGDGTVGPHTLSYVTVTPTNPIVELDLNPVLADASGVIVLAAKHVVVNAGLVRHGDVERQGPDLARGATAA